MEQVVPVARKVKLFAVGVIAGEHPTKTDDELELFAPEVELLEFELLELERLELETELLEILDELDLLLLTEDELELDDLLELDIDVALDLEELDVEIRLEEKLDLDDALDITLDMEEAVILDEDVAVEVELLVATDELMEDATLT